MSEHAFDWRHDLEDWPLLKALPDETSVLQLVGGYDEITLDPRQILKTENQGSQGSCRGHSGSTGAEWIRVIATHEFPFQLSRAMMYYETQRVDNIRGDRGSTIMGGVKVLRDVGLCREDLWPYPRSYDPTRPTNWAAVVADAAIHKVTTANQMKSYDGVRAWLGSGQGYVDCGISWSSAYAQPIVERYSGGNGGHAIALITLSKRKDNQGRPYVWMLNSHGNGSGVNGWSEWSPSFVESAIRSQNNAFVGLSDMPHIKPRSFSLGDLKASLRI